MKRNMKQYIQYVSVLLLAAMAVSIAAVAVDVVDARQQVVRYSETPVYTIDPKDETIMVQSVAVKNVDSVGGTFRAEIYEIDGMRGREPCPSCYTETAYIAPGETHVFRLGGFRIGTKWIAYYNVISFTTYPIPAPAQDYPKPVGTTPVPTQTPTVTVTVINPPPTPTPSNDANCDTRWQNCDPDESPVISSDTPTPTVSVPTVTVTATPISTSPTPTPPVVVTPVPTVNKVYVKEVFRAAPVQTYNPTPTSTPVPTPVQTVRTLQQTVQPSIQTPVQTPVQTYKTTPAYSYNYNPTPVVTYDKYNWVPSSGASCWSSANNLGGCTGRATIGFLDGAAHFVEGFLGEF